MAAAALESAQVVALAILVREQMSQGEFAGHYRPFATIVPGPGYEAPAPIDRQIQLFMEYLPSLDGDAKLEAMAVAKALSEPPRTSRSRPRRTTDQASSAPRAWPQAGYSCATCCLSSRCCCSTNPSPRPSLTSRCASR